MGFVEPVGEPDPRETRDPAPEAGPPAGSPRALAEALRRARVENAERAEALWQVRGAEAARLELLRDRLQPIFEEIPSDCDMFDFALSQGSRPRLFLDMIAFVEMGRDSKTYALLQDTRQGRVRLAESARIEEMARAVADYVARRLIEREKALAGDTFIPRTPQATQVSASPTPAAEAPPPAAPPPDPAAARLPRAETFTYAVVDARARDAEVAARAQRAGETAIRAPARGRPRWLRIAWRALRGLMETIGALTVLAALVLAAAWIARHYRL